MPDTNAQPLDYNKAWGALGSVYGGGAVTRLLAHFINYRWPGAVDAETLGDLSMVVAGGLAWAGAAIIPHSHSS